MGNIVIALSHMGLGGAERVTTVLANELANKGYKVSLIVFSSKYKEYSVNQNVDIMQLSEEKNKIENVFSQVHQYRRLLKKLKPEYIISLGMYKYLALSFTIKKYRYILSERNDPHNHSSFEMLIQKYLFKRSHRVVFQTDDAKAFYAAKAIQERAAIIPNPIKADLPTLCMESREKRIVAFSRLTKQKNIPMMLRAFQRFAKQHKEYVLEIYGVGESEGEIKECCHSLHIEERVKMMGYAEDIHDKIKNATMFVSSSDYEGISNSMIEAMAMGLPVICTDCPCGGAKMMIQDGVNGYLIPVGDADALFEKMCYVVDHPEESAQMGRKAVEIRKRLAAENIVSEWEKLMKEE